MQEVVDEGWHGCHHFCENQTLLVSEENQLYLQVFFRILRLTDLLSGFNWLKLVVWGSLGGF